MLWLYRCEPLSAWISPSTCDALKRRAAEKPEPGRERARPPRPGAVP